MAWLLYQIYGVCTEAEKPSKYSAPRSSSSITPSGRWEPTSINFRIDTTIRKYESFSNLKNLKQSVTQITWLTRVKCNIW
jgi:hypothetical protein